MENENQPATYETEGGAEEKFVDKRRSNVKSDLIEITEDKLENILLKHLSKLEIRKGWVAPLGVFVSVLLATLSATFNDKFGIIAATWEAIFLLVVAVSAVWLVVSLVRMVANWKQSSIDFLICQIKRVDGSEESSK